MFELSGRRLAHLFPRFLAVIATLVALAVVVPPAPAANASLLGLVSLDPALRLHPALQYGARVEPTKPARVIVQKVSANTSSTLIAGLLGVPVLEELPLVKGLVLEAPQGLLPVLARSALVLYVSPDGPIRLHTVSGAGLDDARLETSYPATVGAPAVWNSATAPATGRGVTVAVLDTGVNAGHPDFAHGGLRAVNVNRQARDAADPHGHGTHVIGTIKGKDASGRYLGIAPDARVISVKIADDAGVARESDLLRGLEWVYNQRLAENIRVVSLSVSAGVPTSYRTSPTAAAVEQLWRSGIVVVAASGNRGDALDATWQAPGNDPYVVTVGCLDDDGTAVGSDDALCSFSSRGTTPDGYAKPEVVAPGRRIVSTLAASDATVAQLYPDRVTDREYIRLSGTSMSTPVVSGVVALLLERYPALTPNQVKWLLTSTAKPYPGRPDRAGLVSAPAALSRAALGNVGSANQGLTPSLGLTLLGSLLNGSLLWGSAYWDSAYWDSAYWDSAYWDSAYWDSAYWDSAD